MNIKWLYNYNFKMCNGILNNRNNVQQRYWIYLWDSCLRTSAGLSKIKIPAYSNLKTRKRLTKSIKYKAFLP